MKTEILIKKVIDRNSASRIIGIITFMLLAAVLFSSCSKTPVCENLKPEESDSTGCAVGMDIAFLIDYTSSMSPVIDNIKQSVNNIVTNIENKSKGDYQLSLSIFDEHSKSTTPNYYLQSVYASLPASSKMIVTSGPSTDQYLTMMEKFSFANKATFINQLNSINSPDMDMGWGSYIDEPGGLLAYEVVNNNFGGTWRNGKKKFCFIITDAPDGGDNDLADATDDANLLTLANIANTKNISFILITSLSSGCNYELQLIDNNNGSYKLVDADFSTIAEDINAIINKLCED